MRRLVTWSAVAALSLAACAQPGSSSPSASVEASAFPGASDEAGLTSLLTSQAAPADRWPEPLRLVTLGDSYTDGTGVDRRDSWPQQLVSAMSQDVRLRLVANLADVNNTSEYVLEDQLPQLESLYPDVVSLLVGANDIVASGITLEDYERNIKAILDRLLEGLPPYRIFVITTPDHTLTHHGGDYESREVARKEIDAVNAVLTTAATERDITVIDITPVSDRVAHDPTLVATDGLHPSAKQYAGWVEIIAPTMRRVLLGGET